MYILFAALCSLLVYTILLLALPTVRRSAVQRGIAVGSLVALLAGLAIFNLASRLVGIDLGPFQAVSYNIPDDYLASGAIGLLALVPYALACLSPALIVVLAGNRR